MCDSSLSSTIFKMILQSIFFPCIAPTHSNSITLIKPHLHFFRSRFLSIVHLFYHNLLENSVSEPISQRNQSIAHQRQYFTNKSFGKSAGKNDCKRAINSFKLNTSRIYLPFIQFNFEHQKLDLCLNTLNISDTNSSNPNTSFS